MSRWNPWTFARLQRLGRLPCLPHRLSLCRLELRLRLRPRIRPFPHEKYFKPAISAKHKTNQLHPVHTRIRASATGSTYCLVCPQDTSQNFTCASACAACAQGYYQSLSTASSCAACATVTGTYCVAHVFCSGPLWAISLCRLPALCLIPPLLLLHH